MNQIRVLDSLAKSSRRRMLALTVFALVGTLVFALSRPVHAQTAPDKFVEGLSTEVLEKIRSDKDIQSGNLKRVSEFVDTSIMPNVNFERMTASAVGPGWRQATPEQQKKLMAEFRALLLRTYSGALANVKDQTVRMKPLRADPADNNVVVRSEIVSKRGEPIQLDYRLEKAGTGWKIYDLNILGVWLVETYRTQFSQEINAKGVDGLIQSLTDKNRQMDQAQKRG